MALAEHDANRRMIVAANPAAEALGIRPGQRVADALAAMPGLAILPVDREADAVALRRLADWTSRFSPAVAIEGDDGLMLDITGCAHLWSSEANLLADAKKRLEGFKLHCRAAIADTIGGAWALARFGPADAIQPVGDIARSLADLPPAGLRLQALLLAQFDRLGLRRIGDLAVLPRAALASRFGQTPLLRLDQALGRVSEALSPLLPQPSRQVRLDLAEPIIDHPTILRSLALPLSRLIQLLAAHETGIRRLELACYLVDGTVSRVAIGTARPSLEAAHLLALLAERVAEIDPGEGIEALRLGALAIEPLSARCPRFGEGSHDSTTLAPLIDRLGNRLGETATHRPDPRESHIPERAIARLPALAPPSRHHWPKAAQRPLRLLAHPEPIAVLAPIPDDPPVQFRWRRLLHRVRAAEGPERIAPEWWLAEDEAAEIRDYYRVEDTAGQRFWLYRAGLYCTTGAPRWFLHGLFG